MRAPTVAVRINVKFGCPSYAPPNEVASASSFRPHTAHDNSGPITALFSSFCVFILGAYS
jgi:hypothetical protein